MLESGRFPTEGSEIIQWLVCPGGHGITIIKADSEATAMRIYMVWAEALPGFFESYTVEPALEAQEVISMAME